MLGADPLAALKVTQLYLLPYVAALLAGGWGIAQPVLATPDTRGA
ncbi:hypothetical protein [Halomonas elongata]|uniref:Uncharacterized protein n=1 Tax=Halomonas elongata (strain ATCC 33173 / DSM 2581 / NBRC 15536 / NCIMB 2198 / 1H9) TaxID=768066 RepID=E1V7T9_HALED|nr:hypothetical protein [Halomonas elongata]WPU46108.1 hypothetical protein SR933_12700 [Halomonas elongata DSM 2581]CBV43527.1 uncharacterized protein HELO_3643 [Halomonas elongata DSM 2581]